MKSRTRKGCTEIMKKVAEKKQMKFDVVARYTCYCCPCCDHVPGCRGGQLYGGVNDLWTLDVAKAAARKLYMECSTEVKDELIYEVVRVGPRGGRTVVWTACDNDRGELSFE